MPFVTGWPIDCQVTPSSEYSPAYELPVLVSRSHAASAFRPVTCGCGSRIAPFTSERSSIRFLTVWPSSEIRSYLM